MKAFLKTATALVALASVPVLAHATTILTLGQVGVPNTITATAVASGTTWGNNDILVTITEIDGAVSTPVNAFFDITATSTNAGAVGAF